MVATVGEGMQRVGERFRRREALLRALGERDVNDVGELARHMRIEATDVTWA
jgi:hypothetical protein